MAVQTPTKAGKEPISARGIKALRGYWNTLWNKDEVAERLNAISHRQRLFNLLAILMFATSAVLLYVVIEMSADRIWEFTALSRQLALLSALGLTGAAGIILFSRTVFRRADPLLFAQKVDRALGFDDDALVTYF